MDTQTMEFEDGEKNSSSDEPLPDMSESDRFQEIFVSPLNEGSTQFHELYLSHRAAGFTPEQSIYLLAVTMSENPGYPPKGQAEDE